MSELRVVDFEIEAADLGPKNPLPALHALRSVSSGLEVDETIPAEDAAYLNYGITAGCLPYRLQDGYDRRRKRRVFRAVVLENDILRATFMPHLGGRLWSLFHKPAGKELLCANPVFQPANLAIRNAWFSGGVEWNVSLRGHSVFTCSPLFAAQVRGDDGTPVLRMYEWERIRGVPYQMDFWLPDGSPLLFARMRITNPHDAEVPMYWWSNIATPESAEIRVLVPATSSIQSGYAGKLTRVAIPDWRGIDMSYTTNIPHAADFFFYVDQPERPWIAYVDRAGGGLIQTSTPLLRGRKLFVWGNHIGGARWQEYLSLPGHPYIEIQAGLARTQAECLPMPAKAEWSWLEAYGMLQTDPRVTHGSDWAAAQGAADVALRAMLPAGGLECMLEETRVMADRAPERLLSAGSGWGALEMQRRERTGEGRFCGSALSFDRDAISSDQQPWLHLLEEGYLPYQPPSAAPGGFMVDATWRELLEKSSSLPEGDHWLTWLHLGVMYYHAGDAGRAEEAWSRSLAKEPSAWAYRNLAVLAKDQGRIADAADLWLQALLLLPDQLRLAIEALTALLDAGRPQELLDQLGRLSADVREHGRVQLLRAQAALALDRFDIVEQILAAGLVLPDLREGEVSLSDLWFGMKEKQIAAAEGIAIDDDLKARVRRECPPPAQLDFRMRV